MESVDENMYEAGYDATAALLDTLPDGDLDPTELVRLRAREDRTLALINERLSTQVMASYSDMVAEMARVRQISSQLQLSQVLCSNGRRHLSAAGKELALSNLEVLAKHRQREHLRGLLDVVTKIRGMMNLRSVLATKARTQEGGGGGGLRLPTHRCSGCSTRFALGRGLVANLSTRGSL